MVEHQTQNREVLGLIRVVFKECAEAMRIGRAVA